jgi:hypothetical protein
MIDDLSDEHFVRLEHADGHDWLRVLVLHAIEQIQHGVVGWKSGALRVEHADRRLHYMLSWAELCALTPDELRTYAAGIVGLRHELLRDRRCALPGKAPRQRSAATRANQRAGMARAAQERVYRRRHKRLYSRRMCVPEVIGGVRSVRCERCGELGRMDAVCVDDGGPHVVCPRPHCRLRLSVSRNNLPRARRRRRNGDSA